jgi:hypothetical protein
MANSKTLIHATSATLLFFLGMQFKTHVKLTTTHQMNSIANPKILTSSPTKLKIVGFSDQVYVDAAKIWYDKLTFLGYDEHVIVAVDNTSFLELKEQNYRVEAYFTDVIRGARKLPWVRNLWYKRILYCMEQIANGTSLLLTDVDNIFQRYVPLKEFQNSGFDVIHAYEVGFPPELFQRYGFVVCGGMTWYTANNRTLKFLHQIEQMCSNGGSGNKCNDQKEINKFILLPEIGGVVWDDTPNQRRVNSTDSNNGLLEIGQTGRSEVTGHTIKIWDRDFAWRGPSDTQFCPTENNWVSMPLPLPYSITSKQTPEQERAYRIEHWESYCGKNGTNRSNKRNEST